MLFRSRQQRQHIVAPGINQKPVVLTHDVAYGLGKSVEGCADRLLLDFIAHVFTKLIAVHQQDGVVRRRQIRLPGRFAQLLQLPQHRARLGLLVDPENARVFQRSRKVNLPVQTGPVVLEAGFLLRRIPDAANVDFIFAP